jgi:hypothetical protein
MSVLCVYIYTYACSLFGHLRLLSRSQGRQHTTLGVADLSVAPAVAVMSKKSGRHHRSSGCKMTTVSNHCTGHNGDVMGQHNTT